MPTVTACFSPNRDQIIEEITPLMAINAEKMPEREPNKERMLFGEYVVTVTSR